MNKLPHSQPLRWGQAAWLSWDRFWFEPADAATLAMIRIFTGAMLLYTHLVWGLSLSHFFGQNGWLSSEFAYRYHDSPFGWSHLYWLDNSPTLLWIAHALALTVFAALMVGYHSRVASVLAFMLTVSYAHRAGGALFGLDQINAALAMYLVVGRCGDAFSIDRWLNNRKHTAAPDEQSRATAVDTLSGANPPSANPPSANSPSVSTNIAIRLIQIHLCIVYLFAGCGKLLGESWWDGTALWGAFGNHEYQTLDMTWLANSLVLVNILTHVTLFWEITYAALIWNRIARPIMLALAIPLHLGIAVCMGMVTFGLAMLIANLAFVDPQTLRTAFAPLFRLFQRPQDATAAASSTQTKPPPPAKKSRTKSRKKRSTS